MALSTQLSLFVILLSFLSKIQDGYGQNLKISEKNSSQVFVQLLRGRDGRDGVPGSAGPQGPAGPRGLEGPKGKEGSPGQQGGGLIYIRWGKSSCPSIQGTEMVYTGIAAGPQSSHSGGGSNPLCMPKDPQYKSSLTYRSSHNAHSELYGAEYEHPLQGSHDHNVPCAVCHVSTRSALLLIPAKYACPATWTREYYGYLMSEYKNNKRSHFECMDQDMEALPGSHADVNGLRFFHVEATCNGLPCPPYNTNNELNCVVCTK